MVAADKGSGLQVPLVQEVVLDKLREQMVDGTFPPGAHLNISEIAEDLGVSIVPVREAVKILQSEGRLVRERNRSYRVRELTYVELVQMNQLSTYLEIELIKAGVPNLTESDISKMRALSEQVRKRQGDRHEVLTAHRRLHFVCFEAAGLSVFLENVNRLWDHYEHYRLLFFDSSSATQEDATIEHQQFVEACQEGDVEQAVAIHDQHRQHSFTYLSEIARPNDRSAVESNGD
jgi:DNA-binding GntR family transcriptional regulator